MPGNKIWSIESCYKVINGCWIWNRATRPDGYGVIWDKKKSKTVRAHIFIYEKRFGEVPPNKELHHTCDNPSCVNPEHMEPITRKDHVIKTKGHNKNKIICKRGHVFTDKNTYRNRQGYRTCTDCYPHLRGVQ